METPPAAPPAPATPPPPDFGTAFKVVAGWVGSFKEIALGVSAIGAAGIGAWMYFASQAELTKTRCLIYAHITVSTYHDKINLYDLEIDTKTRIKNAIATELGKHSKAGKLEQLSRISSLEREISIFVNARENTQTEYEAAQRKLASDSCSERSETEEKK